jgi:hypothetical protein
MAEGNQEDLIRNLKGLKKGDGAESQISADEADSLCASE